MMSNKEIIKNLKLLKEIEPDESFANRTRNIVLATTPHSRFIPAWVAGFALAALFISLISYSFIFYNHNPSISSSLEKNFLVNEFNEMDINLQVKKITYSQDVNKTIASALSEITESQADHMNPSILEAEKEYINQLETTKGNDEEIDKLLNKVIF
jgi:hypothetical protein